MRRSCARRSDRWGMGGRDAGDDHDEAGRFQAARARPGLEKQVPYGEITGVAVSEAPLAGVMRLDNLDDKSFVAVRRDLQQDELQLVSMGKGLSFRLSDHISEFIFQSVPAEA